MLHFKMNARRLFVFLVGLICLSLLLVACGNDTTDATPSAEPGGEPSNLSEDVQVSEEVYDLYNKVQLKQTKEEVDQALGVKAEELTSDTYSYQDENGYGVTIGLSTLFSSTDTNEVFTKMMSGDKWLEYQLQEAFRKENAITDEQAASITEGMTYDEVKATLGSEGVEIALSQQYDGSVEIERAWYKDSVVSLFSINFNGIDGKGTVTTVNNF